MRIAIKRPMKKSIILLIWLIPFFSFCYSDFIPAFKQFILIYKILVAIWILLLYALHTKKGMLSLEKFDISVFSFGIVMALSTVVNEGDYLRLSSYLFNIILPVLIVRLYIPKYTKEFLSVTSSLFKIMLTINLALMFKYPAGIYIGLSISGYDTVRYNFLGLDNQIAPYIFAALTFLLLNDYYELGKIRRGTIIWILIIVCNVVMISSATLFIGVLIFFLLLLILNKNKFAKKTFSAKHIPMLSIIIFLSIYYFNFQNLFGNIITNYLGKDLSFSGRLLIWHESISNIMKLPVFGSGIQDSDSLVKFTLYGDYRTAHNMFLQILVMTGIVGFMAFLFNMVYSCKKLAMYRMNNMSSVLTVVFVSFCIVWLTEYYPNLFPVYLILSVANSIGLIIKKDVRGEVSI